MGSLEDFNTSKAKDIKAFDQMAMDDMKSVDSDEMTRLFKCLGIDSSKHKADTLKKAIDKGGKINSCISIFAQILASASIVNVTNPIGWGIMGANFLARGASTVGALKKMQAIDEALILNNNSPSLRVGTVNGLAFAYKKLKTKATRETAGAVGLGVYGAAAAFSHRNKDHKGFARNTYAMILWINALQGDKLARAGCAALTHGKSSNIIIHDFEHYAGINNHNKILDDKDARKALGFYHNIADSMKTK